MHKLRSRAALRFIAYPFSVLNAPPPLQRLKFAGNQFEQFFTNSHGCWKQFSSGALQEQIVDALHLRERSKASTLLSELCRTNEALEPSDFLLILQKCSRLPDPLFALETWNLMKDKQIYMGGKCYLYTIQALSRGGYLLEAFNLMSLLEENPDIYPLLPVYNNFLSACLQTCSIHYATDCLNRMEDHMVGKSEFTYTELLKLAVLQQNLSAVCQIWNECITYYSLSLISLRKFVWSFSMLRDLGSSYVALQQMVALAFQRNFVLRKTDEGKFSGSRLDIPIPSCGDVVLERCTKIDGILSSSKDHDMTDVIGSNNGYGLSLCADSQVVRDVGVRIPDIPLSMPVKKVLRWSFNDVIHACGKTGNCVLAEQLMSQMQNLGLEPSSGTYDGFIKAVVRSRGFLDGMEVIEVMRQKNMLPYDSALAEISVSCSKGLELDLAEAFLEQMSKCTSLGPYNALLKACDVLDQPERAIRVLAKLKKLNLQPDIRTYELLFSLFGNVNAPYEEGDILSQMEASKRINAIETDMMKNGIQHSRLSFKKLMKALGTEGMIKELFHYLQFAENSFSSLHNILGTSTYNTVLHSLVQAKQTHMAAAVFRAMRLGGIPPDAATYNMMIDGCSIIKCFTSASALVSIMIRDGFSPGTVTYTILIKTLLGLEDFDQALELLNQGILDGIEPDVLLYNTIIQAAGEKGRIDVLELLVEQMHREKIQPDSATCSYVFCAYVEMGFHSTAMEAIQVLSLRMISEEDDILEEKRQEFGDLIISEDLETETYMLRFFKESKEDLAVALLYLRWCAMLGLSVSWSPSESKWAIRLSNEYTLSRVFACSRTGKEVGYHSMSKHIEGLHMGVAH